MPLLRVRLRWTAAEHDLPALHADARGKAVQEMRGKLGNKLAACQGRSGVRCEARDNWMACARVEGNLGRRIRERTLGKGVCHLRLKLVVWRRGMPWRDVHWCAFCCPQPAVRRKEEQRVVGCQSASEEEEEEEEEEVVVVVLLLCTSASPLFLLRRHLYHIPMQWT